jgi:hypothetical protein
MGGGYGWVGRKYGLSADALVEAQVWALYVGGGNFGGHRELRPDSDR